ncbi:MAG: glycosyltransferase family 2 protein [Chloroflexi bacterium AL-N10]|nr:glycosyltransferase family 2 protein [Chloroflexi bacterium AL-N1]NOK71111.1 glycosyltransferase family 2 protein [Chloroflexi bacterium AL-N10]NOK77359.1 glycosyltransferase family 2 protein [Chloroflexi bacterium AL-N5]
MTTDAALQPSTTQQPAPATHPDTDATPLWPFSVSVVIPARNEEQSIGNVIRGIFQYCPTAEIIVVDDASTDATPDVSEEAGARVVRRPYNIGNGAGVKTGIREATGDVIIVIDADGQHDPADIPRLLQHIGPYDMVIGERSRTSQENWVRWLGNSALNTLGTYLIGMEMRDLTSGFRAMRREIINEFVHLLPNQYSWPTTSAMSFAKAGYHIRFEPITVHKRQAGQSKQKLLRNGIKFVLIMLRIVSLFAPLRIYFPISLTMFGTGLLLFIYELLTNPNLFIPNSVLGLFIGGIIVFMFGLLAEQIAGLRFKGPDR